MAQTYQTNDEYILEIDGSLYKNKDIINNTMNGFNILTFCKTKILKNKKVVILYNFDEFLNDAQHSLRSCIEKYNKTTIFILTSNNINNIIETIQSRFLIFQINKLKDKHIKKILFNIIESRTDINFKIDNPEIDNILNIINIYSKSDIKQAINYLQLFSYSEEITEEKFYKMFNIPSFKDIKQMIEFSFNILTLNKAYLILNKLYKQGHSPIDILEIILKYCSVMINDNKHKYIEFITNIYIKMDIFPSEIQIVNLLRQFSSL